MTQWKVQSWNFDISGLEVGDTKPPPSDKDRFERSHAALKKKFADGVGFYDFPTTVKSDHYTRLRAVAAKIRKDCDAVVIFGIGGSYLGPMAMADALEFPNGDAELEVYWCSNIDPSEIRRIERGLQGKRVAGIVVSKSGGTVETLGAFFHLSKYLDPRHIVVVTDPEKGELRRLARENKWEAFDVPPNVGGRFSVLTDVGLLPLAILGLSPEKAIEGALKVRQQLEASPPFENPAYQLAWYFKQWDQKEHPIQYLMPYYRNLKLVSDWYVQLFAESLGKPAKGSTDQRVGFTPVSALGTSDQHSILQLLKEGPRDKVVGFLDVFSPSIGLKIQKPDLKVPDYDYLFKHTFDEVTHFALLSTQKSLANEGIPTYRISTEMVDESALGALFFFMETTCAFGGELYGVDAYNQPGVEETKKLLRAAL